jgi:hypothetical protein
MRGRLTLGLLMAACIAATGQAQAQGPQQGFARVNPQTTAASYHAPDPGYPPYIGSGPQGYFEASGHLVPPQPDSPLGPNFFRLLDINRPRMSFRLDYLNWNIESPGNNILGAPTLLTNDLRVPSPLEVPQGSGNQIGIVTAPTLDNISLDSISGIRGTLASPLAYGTFEVEAFALRETDDFVKARTIPSLSNGPDTALVIQPFLLNGAVGESILIYDQAYKATYASDYWGTQANFIWDGFDTGHGLVFKQLFGFRYVSLEEQLLQEGVYSAPDPADATMRINVDSSIVSTTTNHLLGPQIGLRIQYDTPRLTFGVTPKVMLGWNSHSAEVSTTNLLTATEGRVSTLEKETDLGWLFELGVSAKVHVSRCWSLYVSYDLLVNGHVTRPEDNIVYNLLLPVGAVNPTNDVRVNSAFSNVIVQGVSVGSEFRF